ncbi:MAG TPA: alpha/beta fold hydrolase [Spirochaetia bacterium]|nr:alpha/beta fold hydrolase [Spirochaetales bacterium]HRW22872.1 alpha/beta fold hydrolase [Spirochaetia bacterium]
MTRTITRRAAAALALIIAAAGVASAQPAPVQAAGGALASIEYVGSFERDSIRESIPKFFESYRAPEAVYAVAKYVASFGSLDFDGSPVTVKAQLYVPVTDDGSERPVYVFASGTTGIGDACAPSLETPDTKRWGWYEQNMLAYATLGYIVVFPDYTGFNDPDRPQRYFSKLAEGRMMLDAIRAVFDAFPLRESRAVPSAAVFTAGYSQGGHAAMAAADLRPEYAPELPLAGVVTYGSTNDVEALVREGVAYAPLIFYSYLSMYGPELVRPGDYLREKWVPTLAADAGEMPVDEFQKYYGFDYKPLYRPEFAAALYGGRLADEYPELSRLLADNHTGLSGHGAPALVIQGDADFIATTATQTRFVVALREKGSRVKFFVYPKVSHRYTRMAGFDASVAWMDERAAELGVRR